MKDHFAAHDSVKHTGGEYVRYEGGAVIHSNPIESISASSSAVCAAPTSIAPKSTFTPTLRNLTSAIIRA